ncbi:MAG TPA: DnaB-like helicase C-terminal domain-containing protein, partial [Candidatus Paceibacterota bacterium]
MNDFTYEYIARRSISKETHEFFNVKARINSEGKPTAVEYVYPNGAIQVRRLDKKDFFSVSGPDVPSMSEASGWAKDKFPAGSAKAITIFEGADDAMSGYEMLGKYPVYSVRSASSALRDVRTDYDYLNSFEKIYLALDSDEPGQKAAAEIAAVFEFNKVYHVKLAPYKDATDFHEAGKTQEFRNCWFNAARFLPEGVVSSFSEIDAILDNAANEPGHPWPFKTLNYLTDGIKRGRAYLLSGLEGIGKTEFFHAVEYDLAKTDPGANIAIIHLEEPTDENIRKLVGYELRTPTTFADCSIPVEEIKATYRKVAGRDDRIHFYNHYGTDDPDVLLAKIRFFVAACQCKYVFFDNITITATGRMQDDERKELDYFSTKLEMLVKQLKFALIAISHENTT